MEDLKFRALNPETGEFEYAFIYETDEMNEWVTWELPEDSPTNTGTRWDVVQFTGLKYKNGVDAYNGDIFSQRGDISNLLVIEWNDNSASFEARFINGSLFSQRESFSLCSQLDDHSSAEYFGSTHQNPELLNKDKS